MDIGHPNKSARFITYFYKKVFYTITYENINKKTISLLKNAASFRAVSPHADMIMRRIYYVFNRFDHFLKIHFLLGKKIQILQSPDKKI